MIGREDLDECPKCHNTGIDLQYVHGLAQVTYTVRFCGCPVAKNCLSQLLSQPVLKSRIALIKRDILERMAQLHKPRE